MKTAAAAHGADDLLAELPDAILRVAWGDPPRVVRAGGAVREVLGVAAAALSDDPGLLERHLHPADRARGLRLGWPRPDDRETRLMLRWIRPDGEVRWLEQHLAPGPDPARPTVVDAVVRDVTDREHQRLTLTLRLGLASAGRLGTASLKPILRTAAYQLLDLLDAAVVGLELDLKDPFHLEARSAESVDVTAATHLRELRSGSQVLGRLRIDWVRAPSRPDHLEDRLRQAVRALSEAVVQAQNRDSRQLYQRLLDATANAVMVTDPTGTIEWVNQAMCEQTGRSRAELIGATPRILSSGLHPATTFQALWASVLAGEVWRGELVNQRADGTLTVVRTTITPLLERGEVSRLIAVYNDLTELRAADEARARTDERLRALIDGLPVAILTLDPNGRIETADGAVTGVLGAPASALTGRILDELVQFDDHLDQTLAAVAQHGAVDLEGRRSARDLQLSLRALRNPEGSTDATLAVVSDVTAQHQALAEARAARTQLQLLVETTADLMLLLEDDGRIRFVNPAGAALFGEDTDALLGRSVSEFLGRVDPTALHELRRALQADDRRPCHAEVIGADGIRHHLDVVVADLRQDPAIGVVLLVARDLTAALIAEELRQAHQQQLEALVTELAQASRARDDLLSVTSHELRTPLTPIMGFVELLLARDGLGDEQRQLLTVIGRNAKRMLGLVDDLLMVSRLDAGTVRTEPRPTNLAARLEEVIGDLGAELGTVVLEADPDLEVLVDPDHLTRMVVNLLTNARRHGRPPITMTATHDGQRATVSVEDRGPGVPEDFVPRLFDRFAQATAGDRRSQTGSGLGLTIVQALAQANGGEITYRGVEPRGACFALTLPLAAATGGAPPTASEARRAHRAVPSAPPLGGPIERAIEAAHREIALAEHGSALVQALVHAVRSLGGWVIPAEVADDHAMPVDVGLGICQPLLVASEIHHPARRLLEAHLPGLVAAAQVRLAAGFSR